VRVILTNHVADDARALLVRLVVRVAELMHGPEHAPVHGLQPVAHVRQRAADDDRHCVVEIRAPHLVFDVYVIAFRSCFHLKAFPVQSATQSGPVEEIPSLSLALFREKKNR
jgi:hypothetical protein